MSVIVFILLAAAISAQLYAPACAQGRRTPIITTGPEYSLPGPVQTLQGEPPVTPLVMDPPEFRGIWVDTWYGPSYFTAEETTTLVDTLANNNYNAVVAEVRKCGDAYYNSAYEPWANNIAPGYDPLADLIEKAHAKGIEVHAWIVTYRVWNKNWTAPENHIWRRHPDWAMTTYTGNILDGAYYNLDPGIPGVQQYIADVVKDVVSKYDVDGFNFDYIRYPGTIWGYNPLTRQRFNQEYGYDPPTSSYDPNWGAWGDYRRRQVTDLVRKCYVEAVHINPNIKMSVDSVGWSAGNPNVDFTGTRQYYDVFQNSKAWMEEGIIDINILMNYKREWRWWDQQPDYRVWSDWLGTMTLTTDRHAVDGPAAYLNSINDTVTQLQYGRSVGCDGLCTYSYRVTNVDGRPASEFFSAVKANLFANPAPVPDMPWKSSPTTGILFGQVTDALEPNKPVYQNWIYKATVTATGPETRTVETDATGTYAFLNLQPGEYAVTASYTGFAPAQGTPTVTVGTAAKLDFQLTPVLGPSDYKPIADLIDPNLIPDGTVIGLLGKAVTVTSGEFQGCVYVEEPDRSFGIQIRPGASSPQLTEGDRVDLIGILTTLTGERVVDHAYVQTRTAGQPLAAMGIGIGDLGQPPTATGLLVQCVGKVTSTGFGWFTMDDGSGSIKVLCSGLAVPGRGLAVWVTGIVTRDTSGIVLRARRQADIAVVTKAAIVSPSGAIGAGFNLIGLPCVAMEPSPGVLLGGLELTDKLFRWDNAVQNFVTYSSTNPTAFGNLCRGNGYALLSSTASMISYQGIGNSGLDLRISIPKSGWCLMSHPFTSPIPWLDLMVTNGAQTLTLQQGAAAGWIGRIAFTWDSRIGNFGYVGTGARGSRFDDSMRPWRAYWVTTYQDNLALIIPAPASPG